MASGTIYGGTVAQYRLEIDWTATSNTSGNYSTVNASIYIKSLHKDYDLYVTRTLSKSIDSTGASNSAASNLGGNGRTLLGTHSKTVYHNDDGSKKINISASYPVNITLAWAGTYVGTLSASQDVWLDSIPRASSVTSAISFTAGVDNVPFTISRASTSFTHTARFYIQKVDGTWVFIKEMTGVTTGGTFTFSVAENKAIYTAIGGYESRPAAIDLYTYNGGTQVGTGYKTKQGTVYGATPATINFSDFNIGTTSVPATMYNRQTNGNFYYEATLTFGSFTKSWYITTDSLNITFTQTEINSMYQQIPSANAGIGSVYISSKYGGYGTNGVELNDGYPVDQYKRFTAYVVNSNPLFSSFTYADTNAAMNTLKGAGNEAWIIQNKSTVRATILNVNKATAQNYSTIDKYTATLNGVTQTASKPFATDIIFDFGTVDAAVNLNLVITAHDSRGLTTSVTKIVNMVPWAKPVIKTTAARTYGFLEDVALILSGSISPLNVNGVNKNALVSSGVRYRTRVKNGTWGSYVTFLGQSLSMPNYSVSNVSLTMTTTLAYEIEIEVTDKVGNNVVVLEVKVGKPILHIDNGTMNVGVGKFPRSGYALDTAGKTGYDTFQKTQFNSVDSYENLGHYYSNSSSGSVGTICITLNPKTNIMFNAELDIWSYSGTIKYMLGGYTYTATGNWYIPDALALSSTQNFDGITVRFATNAAGLRCILIGNTTTYWGNYLHANLSRVTLGYGSGGEQVEWSITQLTSESGFTGITTVTPRSLGLLNPIGQITAFGGSIAPSGWLLCNGNTVSRSAYANLYGVIGTTYGAGDGSTTFHVPNLSGRVPVGLSADAEFNSMGKAGGAKTHTLTVPETPAHNHTTATNGGFYFYGGGSTANGPASGNGYSTSAVDAVTSATGGNGAHNNLQPYLTVNYIIKY